ncbi:MAG: hypothetical protein HC852_07295 [Acaryochloridaceae cyanobacterium RU_4_10]|nr:hypothetical protein [Acaryochloridaceae cyanobacterium RU_4_10]
MATLRESLRILKGAIALSNSTSTSRFPISAIAPFTHALQPQKPFWHCGP